MKDFAAPSLFTINYIFSSFKNRGGVKLEYKPSYNDFLAHHGIKGQKWGVRRYENYDGTLTPIGKRKYAKYQKAINEVRDTASEYAKYAREDRDNFIKNRDKHVKNMMANGLSKSDAEWMQSENIRIAERQAKRYDKVVRKYSNVKINEFSKKDFKDVKQWIKENHFYTNVDYAWIEKRNVRSSINYEDHD